MIGYVCKYTPVEIIEAFGEKTVRIDPSISNFDTADTFMHPNMCTYTKAVLEECINKKIDKIILVNCCDSIRRLYDVLIKNNKIKFVYLIDLPRKCDCCSQKLFYNNILKFIKYCEENFKMEFDIDKFKKILIDKSSNKIKNNANNNYIDIAIIGSRCKQNLIQLIENSGGNIKYNFTCTHNEIDFTIRDNTNILKEYCSNLLNQYPCMRMVETEKRHNYLLEDKKLKGIIYHTIKFCDYYGYDYSNLKSKSKIPILKLETDYTLNSEGQLKTRIEAFLESLGAQKQLYNSKCAVKKDFNKTFSKLTADSHIAAGIDIGSTSANVVLMDENKKILSYSIVKTGAKSIEGANEAMKEALQKANKTIEDIQYIVSTGYGRISIPFANEGVTEITCHGKGAHFINPNVRTIIDIGGQDSKTIKLDSDGNIKDFAMNDKCAAGTGRFLDMMAKTLEIPLENMGEESLNWKENITISSMCTVFAESEVVSLIAENKEKADIIHGLCKSVTNKTFTLINRVGKEGEYMMTGGVAKNIGVVKCLEKKLGSPIIIPDEPQIIGALGAALIALDKILFNAHYFNLFFL